MFSAKILAETQHPEAAIRKLQAFDRTLPGQYYTMFYLGTCHIATGDLTEALACFQKSLERHPTQQDVPSIYVYMGICLKDMAEYRNALKVLNEAEKYDSERTDIYNLQGFCHFKLKQHVKAIECFNKVISLDPGSAIDYANIASNYRDMGDTTQAIHYYEVALAMDPTIDFARENLQKLKPKFSI
jgi:ribosomal protein S12 methylthiotransferase accessory factor